MTPETTIYPYYCTTKPIAMHSFILRTANTNRYCAYA